MVDFDGAAVVGPCLSAACAVVGVCGRRAGGEARRQALRSRAASLVAGAARHLRTLTPIGARDPADRRAAHRRARRPRTRAAAGVCVLASGDPGFFGIVRVPRGALRRRAPRRAPRAVGGLARLRSSRAAVGRRRRDLGARSPAGRGRPSCRSAPEGGGARVARMRRPKRWAGSCARSVRRTAAVAVCCRLGAPDERVDIVTLAGSPAGAWDPLSVVVLLEGGGVAEGPTLEWGLPEERFAARDGLVTKAEVRAVALGKLALPQRRRGRGTWARAAAVSPSSARRSRRRCVSSRSSDAPTTSARIEANAAAHRVTLEVVHGEAPGALDALPDPDRVFVGGGGTRRARRRARSAAPGRPRRRHLRRARPRRGRVRAPRQPRRGVGRPREADRRRGAARGREPGVRRLGAGVVSGRVLSVSVTEAGRARARRLPFEHVHGSAAATVRDRWGSVDAFVLFLATGVAVRIVAPLLGSQAPTTRRGLRRRSRPASWSPLVGGHAGGANALARQVGGLPPAPTPVITTATDSRRRGRARRAARLRRRRRRRRRDGGLARRAAAASSTKSGAGRCRPDLSPATGPEASS